MPKKKRPATAPVEGAGTTAPDIRDAVHVDVALIMPNEWNPFQMEGPTFEALVQEIRQDGFDDPVKLVVLPEDQWGPNGERYKIVDGEHRWRAARVAGLVEIPAVVRTLEEWDEDTLKLKTVRRNLVRGALNPVKFTRLFNEVLARGKHDDAKLRAAMGMSDRDFKAAYLVVKQEKERVAKEAVTEGQRKVRIVTDVGTVVKSLLEEYGDTVPLGFIFFLYGGQMHLLIEATAAVRQWADMVRAQAAAEGRDINAVVLEWVGGGSGRLTLPELGTVPDEAGPAADDVHARSEQEAPP